MAESRMAERTAELSGSSPDDQFWGDIERMLADIASQARSDPLPSDFPAHVLTWLHQVLATEVEAFWWQDLNGRLRCETLSAEGAPHRDASAAAKGEITQHAPAHHDAERESRINAALASGEAGSAPMASGDGAGAHNGQEAKPRQAWLLCPIRSEGGTAAVIEVLHDRRSAPDENLALEVLRSVAELCCDYLRRFQLQQYARERLEREELTQFARRIHDSLDLGQTAYAIANEGRRVVGCDRVTVLARRGPVYETLAVSGAARWDRRSNSVARLEQLCAAVAAGGDALDSGRRPADLPPQVRAPLDAYLEAAQVREALVVPLVCPPPCAEGDSTPVGALVVEQFSGVVTDEHRQRTAAACAPCAQALEHALVVQRIPWAGLFRHWDWRELRQRSRTSVAVAAGAAVLLLAACLVPADFDIEARGVLQPRQRRDVFAPDDGVVDELFVDHGVQVMAGQPLVALRNPQLDLDLKRAWGELQAARKRLAAIETARVEAVVGATSNSNSVTAARLSGEEAELHELVASLTRQHSLLESQEAELHVASPIAGQVLTWDLPQLLQNRPVHRGQALMTIADPSGRWDIELEVPDRDAGHVLEAQGTASGAPLSATYRLATDPAATYESSVDRVAQSIERTAAGEPALRVLAGVRPGELSNSRPGATVLARIHCGRRSLAYVWLHDVYYAITTRLLF
jgi:multidrug efflux pump subunit AcrA (membrane-fusion protein)